MSTSIIVLGATGDLAGRYLLPALAQIFPAVEGGLHLIGVTQDDIDQGAFRQHVRDCLDRREDVAAAEVRELFASTVDYVCGDVTDPATLARALAAVPAGSSAQSPVVLYLALPHVLFRRVVEALGHVSSRRGSGSSSRSPSAQTSTTHAASMRHWRRCCRRSGRFASTTSWPSRRC